MSIKKTPPPQALRTLPDFRNLGVLLRILVLVNVLALLTVLIQHGLGSPLPDALLAMAGVVELPLFLSVLFLLALQPVLQRLPFAGGAAVVCVLVLLSTALAFYLLGDSNWHNLLRWGLWALGASWICLVYFDYRSLRLSPALAEARLLALTARIRPHFLFNALNGVLGVIRSNPKRAEAALEELSDLFRALMSDNRELVPLAEELALCDRYLALEDLRLGDRLQVIRDIDSSLGEARVPPLMLQPLLENAVYYGVEPADTPTPVRVEIKRVGSELRIVVENGRCDPGSHLHGNQMALENIRERLMLFFDLEARLETTQKDELYRVAITIPYRV